MQCFKNVEKILAACIFPENLIINYKKDLGIFCVSQLYLHLTYKKMPKNAEKFNCSKCNYNCSKKSNFSVHLMTAKHKILTNTSEIKQINALTFECGCGKIYNHRQSLYTHRKKCKYNEQVSINRDILVDNLVKENTEMKSMFMMMFEQNQVNQQKMFEQNHESTKVITNTIVENMSKAGNTIQNNTIQNIQNISFNQYLTQTCEDAESIHDFAARFIQECSNNFKEKWRAIDRGEVNYLDETRQTFFNCLAGNPQHMKFIQTTDVKRGVLYLKRMEKEGKEYYGPATFVKYEDGFEWAGNYIHHELLRKLMPQQNEAIDKLKKECGNPPQIEDYDTDEQYEIAESGYTTRKGEAGRGIRIQLHNAYNFIDGKRQHSVVMEQSKRTKVVEKDGVKFEIDNK
jgi:hypothetical protein